MHIHGAVTTVQSANFASISNEQRAATSQGASEGRKRALKNAQTLGGDTAPEQSTFVGNWLNVYHNQSLADDEYHTSSPGEESDLR